VERRQSAGSRRRCIGGRRKRASEKPLQESSYKRRGPRTYSGTPPDAE
jgi:hypothetical protein